MAATVIESLMITLGMDVSDVQKGMAKAEQTVQSGVKGLVRSLAPLAGFVGVAALAKQYITTAASLGKLAGTLGTNITELHAWSLAAQDAGGSADAFQSSMLALNDKINESSRGEGVRKFFDQLGISATTADGKLKSTTDIMRELAAAADSMDSANFVNLARKLGLDQGTIMLLQQGGDEVEKLVSNMRGMAYTEEDARIAKEMTETLQHLRRAVERVAMVLIRSLGPGITLVSEKFKQAADYIRQHEEFIYITAGVITAVMIPALAKMGWAASKAMLPFLPLIAIILALQDLWVFSQGGESALAGLWELLGSPEELNKLFGDLGNTLSTLFDDPIQALMDAWDILVQYIRDTGIFDPVTEKLKEFIRGLPHAIRLMLPADIVTWAWEGHGEREVIGETLPLPNGFSWDNADAEPIDTSPLVTQVMPEHDPVEFYNELVDLLGLSEIGSYFEVFEIAASMLNTEPERLMDVVSHGPASEYNIEYQQVIELHGVRDDVHAASLIQDNTNRGLAALQDGALRQ